MNILTKLQKEEIIVAHNSAEEMRATVAQLREDGWSDNTRRVITYNPSEKEREQFQQAFPDLVVHPPEDQGVFFRNSPYIYLTGHERVVSEQRFFQEEEE
jgi:hypothetical protein